MTLVTDSFVTDGRIGLLDKLTMNAHFIAPEELHFSGITNVTPSMELPPLTATSSTDSSSVSYFDASLPFLPPPTASDTAPIYSKRRRTPNDFPTRTTFRRDLEQLLAESTTNTKTYTPRSTYVRSIKATQSSSSPSSTSTTDSPLPTTVPNKDPKSNNKSNSKHQLRIKAKSPRHARELERNRQAAANYRTRQKGQLDRLLGRVKEEEDELVRQRGLVYELKDELWRLRNELIARRGAGLVGRMGGGGGGGDTGKIGTVGNG